MLARLLARFALLALVLCWLALSWLVLAWPLARSLAGFGCSLACWAFWLGGWMVRLVVGVLARSLPFFLPSRLPCSCASLLAY